MRKSGTVPSDTPRPGRWVALWGVLAAAVVSVLIFLAPADQPHNASSCPPNPSAGLVVFVADLRKPLAAGRSTLPGVLLGGVADRLPPETELRIYSLSAQAATPLQPVGRLCIGSAPFALVDQPTVCGPAPPKRSATGEPTHCDELRAARQRLNELAASTPDRPVDSAFLVEAIDEARREFTPLRQPGSLYLVSDMMQHAAWFSHLDTPPDAWDVEMILAAVSGDRDTQPVPLDANLAVQVFYLPRAGSTASQPLRDMHQRQWRRHFAAHGFLVAFDDQPTMSDYAFAPATGGAARFVRRARTATSPDTVGEAADQAGPHVEGARAHLQEVLDRVASQRDEIADRQAALLAEEKALREAVEMVRDEIKRLKTPSQSD